MTDDNLSAEGVVEEFGDQFNSHPTLPDYMAVPGVLPNDGRVELTSIGVYGKHQHKGYAREALHLLTALCDANGVTIELVARPLPNDLAPGCPASLSTDDLVRWCTKLGFEDVGEPGDDACRMNDHPR